MFENLKALVIQESEEGKARKRQHIESGAALKNYSTPAKWAAYQAGTLPREKAVALAIARMEKQEEKYLQKQLEKIAEAEAAPDAQSVVIHVEWKRSCTWGYNPHAAVVVNHANRYEGSASGCGYDKRTAAVGNALNESAVIRRMLYQAKEKALADGKRGENRDCIAYGAGYGALPYFEGGVGMSSFRSVFAACGLTATEYDESGKHYDYYYFERVEK